jgi:3-hydroxyisobutyrate dehydrogenase-like beta-hydroxyacid dehydrogenase
MNIGFIGLGIMGKPMAKNLLKAGHTLVVYDVVAAPVKELVEAGATAGTSPKDVASRNDLIITMLPNSPHVKRRTWKCLTPRSQAASQRPSTAHSLSWWAARKPFSSV